MSDNLRQAVREYVAKGGRNAFEFSVSHSPKFDNVPGNEIQQVIDEVIEEYPIAVNLDDLSDIKKAQFDKMADNYSMALQEMNLFIEVNELDYDEAWDTANQVYDEDMSYAPNDRD